MEYNSGQMVPVPGIVAFEFRRTGIRRDIMQASAEYLTYLGCILFLLQKSTLQNMRVEEKCL